MLTRFICGVLCLVVLSILVAGSLMTPPVTYAAFPGYNGKIIFISDRSGNWDIWTMNTQGGDLKQLTDDPASDFDPRWDASGQKIVFESQRTGNGEIFVMNADGSGVTQLTSNPGLRNFHPSFSADGSKIVFASTRDGNQEIYVMNVNGSNQTNISNNPALDNNADWSPNGSTIAFTSNREGGLRQIFTMSPDGSGVTWLTLNTGFVDADPRWSPDGLKIVFATSRPVTHYDHYIMNADGTNQIPLDVTSNSETSPSFSPDGTFIIYNSDRGNPGVSNDLFKVDINLDQTMRLTTTASQNFVPIWQPIPNTAPVLAAKSLSLQSGSSKSVEVLAGAIDEEGLDASNLSISIQPNHGTATIEAGKVKYTPTAGYTGTDQLTYRICDSFTLDQKCSTAVLGISVTPALGISKLNDQGIQPGGSYTSATASPTFSGTATPGSEIKVEIHSDPIILTTTADTDGNWSVTPSQPLPPGNHTVIISATLNGQTTTLDSFVLGIQAELPQAGASLLQLQILGSAMVYGGYALRRYDQQRRMRREIRPILRSMK